MVFESGDGPPASLGESLLNSTGRSGSRIRRPLHEIPSIRDEFFGGDVLDRELLGFIRFLRPSCRTGLISNGWPICGTMSCGNRFEDAFDVMVISAEVGCLKPDPRIYTLALEKLGRTPGRRSWSMTCRPILRPRGAGPLRHPV